MSRDSSEKMDQLVAKSLEISKGYSNLNKDVKSLEIKLKRLSGKRTDIKSQVQNAERSGKKKRKREVENWLDEVEEIENEFSKLMEGGLFSNNVFSSGDVAKVDARVEQLMEQTQHFGELWLLDFEKTKLFGQMLSDGLKSIWEWLVTDKISNIGIYGRGGVGKTTLAKHIHNYFREKTEFKVYWITVSQEFSIKKLQDDIAKLVKIDLSDADDEDIRANKLSRGLVQHSVLILDDVWQKFSFEKIGMSPGANKCRLILTTRLLDVCKKMCQRSFEVKTLDTKESWELFKYTLDAREILPVDVEEIAKSVTKECAGLPLAIVTVAGSMRGIDDMQEWRNALEQLKACSIGHEEMEGDVFPILEWSFNRLNECQKHCFLYCSLYPEGRDIEREELVNLFIAAELMRRRDTRQSEFDQGHTILNKLVRIGLLEKTTTNWDDRECVKMHDLIRDMAIRIASGKYIMKITENVPRLLVKSKGVKQEEWTEDLDAVSVWDMEEEIPADMSPKCPKLLTLLFRDGKIKTIPDSFFRHMGGLKVLNLKGCEYLPELPNCVSEMVNLTALILEGCMNLAHVPPLGKLEQLRELILSDSGIKHIPEGLEELVNLESLDMSSTNLEEEIPSDMSPKCPKLSKLHFRHGKIKTIPNSFFRHMGVLKVLNLKWCTDLTELPNCVSEMVNLNALILDYCRSLAHVPPMGKLKQLRELNLCFSGIKHIPEGLEELVNLESLDMWLTNLEEKIIPRGTLSKLHRLKQLKLPKTVRVCDPEVLNQLEVFEGELAFTDICAPFIISHWPKHYQLNICQNDIQMFRHSVFGLYANRKLVFEGCNFRRGLDMAWLPKDIQHLEFHGCVAEQSDVFQILNSSNDLLHLTIESLEGVEFLLKLSSPPPSPLDSNLIAIPYGPLQKLKKLELRNLPDLVGLFDYQLLLPPGTFSSLEDVSIHRCDKLRKLFTVQFLQSLKKLRKLSVRDCKELEEIAADEEEVRGSGGGGIPSTSSGPANTLILSRLESLELRNLPRLKNICKATIICNSIQAITVIGCPNVTWQPLFLPKCEVAA